MQLKKIISGFQTGADIGGIIAGKKFGLETGGHIPKGWRTEDGPKPEYGPLYGAIEHTAHQYPPRTIANVANSKATIRIAHDLQTSGEKCTLRAIKDLKRPHIDVDAKKPRPVEEVAQWLVDKEIDVLNVAGNCESRWDGMQQFVTDYLLKVFECLQHISEK